MTKRTGLVAVAASIATVAALAAGSPTTAQAAPPGAPPQPGGSVAWQDGGLRVDTAGVVSRSDLVLEQPAWREEQSMPLGNGRLGVAAWNRDGLTAQLNRNDTFPDLKTAGRLVVPGLMPLASDRSYGGRVDLYDAQLEQRGGGMTATSYVRADKDQLVLDVTGAPADKPQTATLTLPSNRQPATYAGDGIAALAETFTDKSAGTTTGAVAALTADGRDVSASVVDAQTVRLTFTPRSNGSFRLVVGVPAYTGGDVAAASHDAVADSSGDVRTAHLRWWHRFWDQQVAPMVITSRDGTGEYAEGLRAQQLYTTASTQRNTLPTGQAGAANMLYPWPDKAVSPSTWFHFNLRQQVFANYGAGTAAFNGPYLRLYTTHLQQILDWTRTHWSGAEGACVPELIKFDGTPDGCVGDASPTWTNKILTGGLEVAHDVWETYRYTGDESWLDQGYPLMREVGRFYLSQLQAGDDGRLHLHHANSFETQWDATDPTTDVAGMRVMFPVIAKVARQRGDAELADRLDAATPKLPEMPTTTRRGDQVLGWSASDEAAKNTQNTDLEPVYPWGLLGADSTLAQDTFDQRVFPLTREWDDDPIWAARLHRGDEMKDLIVQGTQDLQKYPSGFTVHGKNDDPESSRNLYSSWAAIVAGAVQDGLVQTAPDGAVEVGASVPKGWEVAGSVQLPGGHRVSTQVVDGAPEYVGVEAGSRDTLDLRNPWPGQQVRVVDGTDTGRTVVAATNADDVSVPVVAGRSYVLERVSRPLSSYRQEAIGGTAATRARHLGTRTLGVASSTAQIQSDLVRNVAPEKLHALVEAREGNELYADRSDSIASLPGVLNRSVQIPGVQGDAKATTPKDYLSFDLAKPATVYVGMDARGEGTWWPTWLQEQGFQKTSMKVGTRSYVRPLDIQDGHLRASGSGITLSKEGADWGDQVIDVTVRQIQVGAAIVFRAPDTRNG